MCPSHRACAAIRLHGFETKKKIGKHSPSVTLADVMPDDDDTLLSRPGRVSSHASALRYAFVPRLETND
jgi:hypothetical protein